MYEAIYLVNPFLDNFGYSEGGQHKPTVKNGLFEALSSTSVRS